MVEFFSPQSNSFLIYEDVSAFKSFGFAENLQFVFMMQKLSNNRPGSGGQWKQSSSPVSPL